MGQAAMVGTDAVSESDKRAGGSVRRRKVYYFPGFDPKRAGHYHSLYATEAVKQAAVSGYQISVSPRPQKRGKNISVWQVQLTDGGITSEAEIAFLNWCDIITRYLNRNRWASMADGLRFLFRHTLWTGTIGRLWRLRKMPTLVVFFPSVFTLLYLIVGGLLGWGLMALAVDVSGWSVWWFLPLLPVAVWLVLRLAWAIDGVLYVYYLNGSMAFIDKVARGEGGDIDERTDSFVDDIIAAARDPQYDEVLIVGHSLGGSLAARAMVRALERAPEIGRPGLPRLGFLTLGQNTAVMGQMPGSGADAFRANLRYLGAEKRISWAEITVPQDSLSYWLVDPVATTSPPGTPHHQPKVVSGRFKEFLTAETWRKLRYRFVQIHFRYLYASELPCPYDYFQITAGNQTLAERFDPLDNSPRMVALPSRRF